MDGLRVVAVGYEGFFQGCVEYIVTCLGLVFVNEFVPPIDTREERVAVGVRERGRRVHAEHHREALAVAAGHFLIPFEDQDAIDIRGVFHEKLQVPLAGADELRIPAELRKRYGKPALGFIENPEELVQFCFNEVLLHLLEQGVPEEPRPEVKYLPIVQVVFPCCNLESPEGLSGAFEKRAAHGDSVSEERRISMEVGDIYFLLGYVEFRRVRFAELRSVACCEYMVA